MRIQIASVLLTLLAAGIAPGQTSPPAISTSCQNGGEFPNCIGGEIAFTGSGYSGQVHVTVTNGAGEVMDDGDYTTADGVLRFVENLSFAGTYTISINGKAVLTVTTP